LTFTYASAPNSLHLCLSTGTATHEISPPSLHDALPIYWWPPPHARKPESASRRPRDETRLPATRAGAWLARLHADPQPRQETMRSEEHTSELQSRENLVCRLLLEKKNTKQIT